MLKKILLGLLAIIALLLIVALFIKKDYAVEREITINKSNAAVFDFIKHIKNQDNYSVWNKKDPGMKKTYTGEDGTVGFISAWESKDKEVGTGEQEIKKITEGERVDLELRFKVPFESTEQAYMSTEALGEAQSKVKWGFVGKMNYPMNLWLLFLDMEEMIGGDLSGGLTNLKVILESQ